MLITLFLSSCASSRRLGRFFSEKSQSAEKTAERTNMFPLYYESGEASSVLWPLIDKDEHGLAVRPFYNQEDNEYAVLFPLSAWNPVKGDGWVGPYVWGEDYSFLFPLYYEDDDSAWFAGLYGWEKSEKKSVHKVLFSLLGNWTDHNNGNYSHYLFPWYSEKDGDVEHQLLFPLHYGQKSDNGSIYASPLYWFEDKPRQKSSCVIPFYYACESYDKEGELTEKSWGAPPLLPLVSHKETSKKKSIKSLYGLLYSDTKTEKKREGSVLGFLAGWKRNEESSRFRIPSIFNMTGLVDLSETKDTSKVNFLLYSHEKSPEITRRDIFPFMTWDSGKNESGFSFLWRVFETHKRNGKKGGHIFFIPWGA
jgi:hypothetical protein